MATRVDRLHVLLRRWPVTGTVCGCVYAELRGEPTVRRGLTHRWHRLNETPEQDETMAQLKPWNSLVRASPWRKLRRTTHAAAPCIRRLLYAHMLNGVSTCSCRKREEAAARDGAGGAGLNRMCGLCGGALPTDRCRSCAAVLRGTMQRWFAATPPFVATCAATRARQRRSVPGADVQRRSRGLARPARQSWAAANGRC